MTDLPPPGTNVIMSTRVLNTRLVHAAAWIIVVQAVLSLTILVLSVLVPAMFLALGSS